MPSLARPRPKPCAQGAMAVGDAVAFTPAFMAKRARVGDASMAWLLVTQARIGTRRALDDQLARAISDDSTSGKDDEALRAALFLRLEQLVPVDLLRSMLWASIAEHIPLHADPCIVKCRVLNMGQRARMMVTDLCHDEPRPRGVGSVRLHDLIAVRADCGGNDIGLRVGVGSFVSRRFSVRRRTVEGLRVRVGALSLLGAQPASR